MFPLSKFAEIKCAEIELDEKDGRTHALFQTIDFLQKVYASPLFLPWRDNILIGTTKETVDYGNTSVSMGLAAQALEGGKASVAFINYGTGGGKYQWYGDRDGKKVVLGETKPTPKMNLMTSDKLNEVATEIWTDLQSAPWKNTSCLVYCFVTGPLRTRYFSGEEKLLEDVTKVFEPLGVLPWTALFPKEQFNYFLPHAKEGALELIAVRCMYANLGLAQPAMSLGIGRGSAQLTIAQDKTCDVLEHSGAMDNPRQMMNMSSDFMKQMDSKVLEKAFGDTEVPVIALKSGCLLLGKKLLDLLNK